MHQKDFLFDLMQFEAITGDPMKINTQVNGYPVNCGGFSYALEYLDGPLLALGPIYLSVYSETTPALKYVGTPTDFGWIGKHTYRIKCTNGVGLN